MPVPLTVSAVERDQEKLVTHLLGTMPGGQLWRMSVIEVRRAMSAGRYTFSVRFQGKRVLLAITPDDELVAQVRRGPNLLALLPQASALERL